MNVVKVVSDTNEHPDALHVGDVLGLWDVARNKIIGLTVLSVFYRQAKDAELKDLLKNAVDQTVTPNIAKIQKMLKEKGYSFPYEQNWSRKTEENSSFFIPDSMMDDEEIAISLREIIRLSLTLDAESLRTATEPDVRSLLRGIFEADNTGLTAVIALQKKKNWADPAPYALPQ